MIRQERQEGILVLTLDRPPVNALDPELLEDLYENLQQARIDLPRGLVLTGSGNIFSAGLDLKVLAGFDLPEMKGVLDALYRACVSLFTFPRPTIASLNGHTLAGGAILSLACDRRHIIQGDGKWGLTESSLKVSMPAFAVEMMRYALDRQLLEKLLYGGCSYPAFKVLDMGILDQWVDSDDMLESATEIIETWTRSEATFADIKCRLHQPTVEAMAHARNDDDSWLDLWFAKDFQARLAAFGGK